MINFPNCKINIGLYITNKRADGYHTIETIFYPITINDVLEIIPATPATTPTIQLTTTGLGINGDTSNNLCVKAYNLLQQHYPEKIKPVLMHLHKTIPMGAGLGGGSANGAFTLTMLNKLFQLQLTQQQLVEYALQLGSDCPFFIHNTPCFAIGRGEILQPILLQLATYYFVIVNPNIHVNTAWAFSNITPAQSPINLQQAIQLPIEEWKHTIANQFEAAVIQHHPEIETIKNTLYQHKALYASMSGSGSTVYGIFKEKPTIQFPQHYYVTIIEPQHNYTI